MNPMKRDRQTTASRNSGIELLRIFAVILIVISHVVLTIRSYNPYISNTDYRINLSLATTNIQHFILMLLSYTGALANAMFFICSAWFLLSSTKYNKHKWFFMLAEVWFVSIVILIVTLIHRKGAISGDLIFHSLLPTTFNNNWYLTSYLLFYPIHPFLNSIIQKMNKRQLFRCSAALFVLYCVIGFLKWGFFCGTTLTLWITIYFIMAYIQLYMKEFAENVRSNWILLGGGITGVVSMAAVTNILGFYVPYINGYVLHWVTICNPFLLAISIASFNLVRKLTFQNKIVNYMASLSMLIYIIHENIILRRYYRPAMWNYVYQNYGYDYILLWVLILTAIILIFSYLVSILYDKTIRPLVRKAAEKIYSSAKNIYLQIEGFLLDMK